jgi:hypothetical protein
VSNRNWVWVLLIGYCLGVASWLILPHVPSPACVP